MSLWGSNNDQTSISWCSIIIYPNPDLLRHSGSHKGTSHFLCRVNHGVFIRKESLQVLSSKEARQELSSSSSLNSSDCWRRAQEAHALKPIGHQKVLSCRSLSVVSVVKAEEDSGHPSLLQWGDARRRGLTPNQDQEVPGSPSIWRTSLPLNICGAVQA